MKGWGQTQTGYFATVQNVTSTIAGIAIGSLMAYTRRFKVFLVGGVIVRIIGVSMMIRYRNNHDPTFMLVLCQLLQGIGGGSVAITMQIAAQVCVRHADVAIVTALGLLTTEIGAAIGSAAAGWIFTTRLPMKLEELLIPLSFSQEQIAEVFGSLSKATSYPLDSPERVAISEAWTYTMHQLCIMAALILVPGIPLSLMIPDYLLPGSHKRSRTVSGTSSSSSHHRRSHDGLVSRRSGRSHTVATEDGSDLSESQRNRRSSDFSARRTRESSSSTFVAPQHHQQQQQRVHDQEEARPFLIESEDEEARR